MKKILLILTFVSACSSSPAIPDDTEARNYRSTYTGGEKEKVKAKEEIPPPVNEENILPKAIGPVAMVDGKPVPALAFNTEMKRLQKTGTPINMIRKLQQQLTMKLVDQQLIENAILASKIVVSKEKIDAKMEQVRQEFQTMRGKSGETLTLEMMTKQIGISAAELRKSIKQSVALETLLAQEGLKFDEASVKAFYDENPDNFARPDQIRASHILLKVEKSASENDWKAVEEKIKKLHKVAMKKKTDFSKLAEVNSEDTLSAKRGGELGGFFPKGVMVPEFEESAFALKRGEISKPIRTQYGWHIIKLLEKRAAGPVPFDEVKDKLKAQLKANGMQQYLGSYVTKLRQGADIKLLPDNIK